MTIQGAFSDPDASFFTLSVNPCSLADSSQCAGLREVASLDIRVISLTPTQDLSNYHNPVDYTSNSDELMSLNPELFQAFTKRMKSTLITDSVGLMSATKQKSSYSEVESTLQGNTWRNSSILACDLETADYTSCRPYLEITFLTSSVSTLVHRYYKGILPYLGELGGLIFLFFCVFHAVYLLYHDRISQDELVARVYGLKSKSRWGCCTSKGRKSKDAKYDSQPASSSYLEIDGHLLVNDKEMCSARDQVRSSMDIAEIIKEIETVKFVMASLFNHQFGIVVPALNWKAADSGIDIEQFFSTRGVTSMISKPQQHVKHSVVQNLRLLVTLKEDEEEACQSLYSSLKGASAIGHRPERNTIPDEAQPQPHKAMETHKALDNWKNSFYDLARSLLPLNDSRHLLPLVSSPSLKTISDDNRETPLDQAKLQSLNEDHGIKYSLD